MKKILALLLALTMVCGMLAACGDTQPQGGNITPLPSESEPAPTETDPVPTETESTPTESGEKEVSLGAMNGGVYTNTYVGFTCTLDENWAFATAEELQELPGNVAELFEGTELEDVLSQHTQITDMLAENVDTLTTVNVVYTKLGLQERLAYAMLDEKEILEQVLSQQELLTESYAAAGIMVSDMELVTIDFLGEERYAIHTTATMQDVPYFILQVYDYHLGSYGVVTTFASFIEDNTAYLPVLFYPLA